MSRLKVVRIPDSDKPRKAFPGIDGNAAQGFCQDKKEDIPQQEVFGDLRGKVQCTVSSVI